MAISKKASKLRKKVVEKKKMLGALVILAFVAFGSLMATYYLMKSNVDILKATIVVLFVGGIVAVFIEMRGKLGKKISKVRARYKARRKTKHKLTRKLKKIRKSKA